jgi:hypothetical protein
MNGIIGIPATLRLVSSQGERVFDHTLHGWIDGKGTFHYTEMTKGRGPIEDKTIPNAATLVDAQTVITLNERHMTIQRNDQGLQVTTRGGYDGENFVHTVIPQTITRAGIDAIATPSFKVGQDIEVNGQIKRVDVIFEAP